LDPNLSDLVQGHRGTALHSDTNFSEDTTSAKAMSIPAEASLWKENLSSGDDVLDGCRPAMELTQSSRNFQLFHNARRPKDIGV
jgi:hypothetical protein